MTSWTEWIAMHALAVWAVLLAVALLTADLAWKRNLRWHQRALANGCEPVVLRWPAALLLFLTMALLFVTTALAISVSQPSSLSQFDTSLARSLHADLPLPLLRVVAVITYLGDSLFIIPAAILVLGVLLLRRRHQLAGVWTVAMLGIVPVSSGLKAIFQRARPLHDHGYIVEYSWSFPSGHAFGSIAFYGLLAYLGLRLLPARYHRRVIAASVLLIGVVGCTRVLLQVHYFSDVVAGYASGACWLLLCMSLAEYLHAAARRRQSVPAPGPEAAGE
jgi:membrane-associated phospholipid phosphatase